MGGYFWEGVSKKIGAREQQLLLVMANPLHRRLTKALLLNRGDVMGHPKPYLGCFNCCIVRKSPPTPPPPPHKYITTNFVISKKKWIKREYVKRRHWQVLDPDTVVTVGCTGRGQARVREGRTE